MTSATAAGTGTASTRRFGRYALTGRLGRGGMGMVYSGHDPILDRIVAVKTLSVEATIDAESRRRFEVEARAAARLQHPNIVTVYELGEDRGVPFIAMELLAGTDLESARQSELPLSLHEILEIVSQVARGLAYAHENGIVHRDIKPTNVRLLDDGGVKIMDFGIAKLGGMNLTRNGMMVGTVYYMSPEQVQAKPLDGRSDVFSLGVILHELIARRRPFEAESTSQILYKIVHTEAPPLEGDLGQAGPALTAAVAKALARDPEARFANAGRFAEALAEVLTEHLGGQPARSSPAELDRVAEARQLLRSGRTEEARQAVADLVREHPGCLEARRLWRVAHRPPHAADVDPFRELDKTFEMPETRQQPVTGLLDAPPTVLYAAKPAATPATAPAPPTTSGGRGVWTAGLIAGALVLAAGVFLLRSGTSEPARPATPPVASVAPQAAPVSTLAEVTHAAKPLPPAPVTRPAARPLAVTTPETNLPTGSVSIRSSYPIDVMWQGRVLARDTSAPVVQLPVGRQQLSLVSERHFLRRTVSVDVTVAGSAALETPALGRVSIKANPDNCEVSIDGVFADYPPILDRPLAEGTHSIAFKWADGVRREETVEVTAGRPSYVTGRKD